MNTPSNWLRNVSFGLSAAAALGVVSPSARGQTYGVMQIPTLGGSINTALAINNAAWVTGNSNLSGDTETHAFIYSNGVATDLGTLGGNNSYANGINNAGVVVGNAYTSGAAADLAFIDSNGVMASLGALSGTLSYAEAVNSSETVVGLATLTGDATHHAFSNTGGVMTDLGTLGGPMARGMCISTFHSMCARILRREAERLGYKSTFSIYDADAAKRAIAERIGGKLNLAVEHAALGISEMVDENMANAARVHAIESGKDLRPRTLIAFGGAAQTGEIFHHYPRFPIRGDQPGIIQAAQSARQGFAG